MEDCMKKNKWIIFLGISFTILFIIIAFWLVIKKEVIDQKNIHTQQNVETDLNKSKNTQSAASEPSVKMMLIDYASEYSQVLNNHFYFLRMSSESSYILYEDQAKEVLSFSLEDEELRGFAIYHSQYFVLIRTKTGTLQLGIVDRADKDVDILCAVYASKKMDCILLYQDCLYICESEEKRIECQTMQGEILEPITFYDKDKKSDLDIRGIFLQEYLYYLELDTKGEILLNKRSFQGNTETVISCPSSIADVRRVGWIRLEEVTEQYVYFSYGYDGKDRVGRISLYDKKLEIQKIETSEFDYTTQYVFYIDQQHNVNRIGWKEKKGEKCNSLKASELSCLDKKIYVKAYTEEMELFEDSEDDPAKNWSDAIYSMDFDGKECKKIFNENYEWMNDE